MSTFYSQETSTSSSSEKYDLNETDESEIFVYRPHHGYKITTEKQLCKELDSDRNWRCSRKPISRGASRVDVQQIDLYNEPERTTYAELPNAHSSVGSIGLPMAVKMRRMLFGHFKELYIVSPINSPENSADSSLQSSQHTSPSSTFNMGSQGAQ